MHAHVHMLAYTLFSRSMRNIQTYQIHSARKFKFLNLKKLVTDRFEYDWLQIKSFQLTIVVSTEISMFSLKSEDVVNKDSSLLKLGRNLLHCVNPMQIDIYLRHINDGKANHWELPQQQHIYDAKKSRTRQQAEMRKREKNMTCEFN